MAAHGQPETDRPSGATGLRISGFGSLGLSHVDAPAGWGYRRELTQGGSDSSWRHDVDTRLGVQLNYSLGTQFELVAQAIARKRGSYTRDSDALEWAYAAYRPNADWTVRVGRVNLDAFLMADYRNVGYGFTAARPPVELYAMLPTALDGADVARSWFQGDAQWRAKLMLGTAQIGDFHTATPGRVHDIVGFMLSREESGLLMRGSASRTRIELDLGGVQDAVDALGQLGSLPIPAVADQALQLRERLGGSDIWATFLELGLRYELGDWQWSAEVVRISAAPLVRQLSAYATVGHRLGDWTPFVGYGRTRDAMPVTPTPAWQAVLAPVLGPAGAGQSQMLGALITDAVNRARVQQSGWSVGTRWDFHPQAALKLQWDRIRVDAGGPGLWTGADGAAAKAHVATAVVDFIF
ncbi:MULTISPECIES: hypothetical protein [unclassified Roseateles]|uniref:hypothetical protein n=1 Tax=unclassified Roseateles TaxID=2626991 RepID=UPI0006FFD679|nr:MULTISPECIES: hypothetical protein [unclassified Roseateles]KQW43750.1 hypothetical protein ASC81_18585 [Pelomonas sp. Root405]KRA71488.1 hypothetical protein ASD88_17105 [Pelomonas sp. Root662]